MTEEVRNPGEHCRRRALRVAVSSLCSEAGFSTAEETALETLTEIMQSYLVELGRSARGFCELSGRTDAMLSDVVMALIEMGMDIQSLPGYARRKNKTVFMPPAPSLPGPSPKTLQAGLKKSHPSHIPEHLPVFPDPHTYIRTPTQAELMTEYQIIREKAATQKRDVELGLTRFMAKTGHTDSLFSDDPLAYPLIANKCKPLPYLDALLPKDQELGDDLGESIKQQAKKQEQETEKQTQAAAAQQAGVPQAPVPEGGAPGGGQANLDSSADMDNQIDNPYLRPIKMPKLQKKRNKYF